MYREKPLTFILKSVTEAPVTPKLPIDPLGKLLKVVVLCVPKFPKVTLLSDASNLLDTPIFPKVNPVESTPA